MINKIMASLVLTIILILVEIVNESEFSDTREDGDIIDCVHMKNHPIYDNLLFKNHTIQMKPNSYPERWNNKSFFYRSFIFTDQVYPEKYGNDNPRYFVYWTADGYEKTGCYNLDCPGFIAINREFVLGGAIDRVSKFGKHQEEMVTLIWKDHQSGHWWLKVGTHVIGYWHSSIFKGLRNGATEIDWGGEIVNFYDRSQHTTTHMGSGLFAEDGLKKGSYFRNIEVLDQKLIPKKHVSAYSIETAPGCYNVKTGTDKEWGFFFYYGGPGRNPKCN